MDTKRTSASLITNKLHSSAFTEPDPIIASIMSKLITPKGVASNTEGNTNLPTQHELQPLMRDTIQRINDADYAFEVLSDLEMVAQVAISSILSSKDLITTTINYDCRNTDLPFELRTDLIKIISDHFNDEYKLQSYLYDILYDVMFKTGSYAAAIIPESSVDALIKSGREGVAKENVQEKLKTSFGYRGVLGSTDTPDDMSDKIGLECFNTTTKPLTSENSVIDVNTDEGDKYAKVHITDNIDMLKLPTVNQIQWKTKVASTYNTTWASVAKSLSDGVAQENHNENGVVEKAGLNPDNQTATGDNLSKFDNSIYSDSPYSIRHIEELPTSSGAGRPNLGHPLVQHLPSESVIPVHVPGDMKRHVGYLVLLDKLGNPVNRKDLMNTTQAWSWISGDATSALIKDAAEGLGHGKSNQEKWTIAKLTDCYADLVDRKLKNSLANGLYGEGVTITRPQEVYRIMLARALSKKQTQILYVPVEQLTYFAFDYTDAGIGRSLTDKNKVVTAGRAALMFATLQSSVLNATRNMQYTVELDPNDREPEKTIDDAQHRIMQGYGGRIPFTGSIDDMDAYFTNAGISLNVEGNEYYPSTKISVSDNTPDYKTPDRAVDEDMAKRIYRGYGVDPDLIMSPNSIEYATQVVSKDLIATKQTCKRQEKFNPLLTHFCRTYTISSGVLMKNMAEGIIKHYEQGERKLKDGELGHYINLFINSMDVTLPPPDMSLLASQMDAYEEESKAIDEMTRVFIDEDFLSSMDVELDARNAQQMVGNYLRRNWFRKNGIMPELSDMFNDRDQRQDYIKAMADDNVDIVELIMMATKRSKQRIKTAADKIASPEEELGDGGFGEMGGEVDGDELTDATDGDGFTDDSLGSDEFDTGGDAVDDFDSGPDIDLDADMSSDAELEEPDVDEESDAVDDEEPKEEDTE